MSVVVKLRIQGNWLDRIIGKVSFRRDHVALAQQEENLLTRVIELRKELGRVE